MTLMKPSYSPPMSALPDGLERHLAGAVLVAVALALGLGPADRRDLRPRVGRARHLDVVDLLALGAGDVVHGGDALVGGDVGEQQTTDQVADRIEVRLGGAHAAVDLHEALLDLGARRFEADVLRVGRATGRHQHLLGAQLGRRLALLADHQADALLVGGHRRRVEPRAGHDLDAAPVEAALQLLGHLGVLERHDSGQVLEQGHLDAGVVVEAGELDADGARADDDDRLGHRRGGRRLVAGDDALAVRHEPGQAT